MTVLIPPVLASAIKTEPYHAIMALEPVVYWPMDESSGNLVSHGSLVSKDAVANGTPAYGTAKIVPRSSGGAIEFDGSTDYFQVTDAAITGTNPEFSFGFWMSTDTITGDHTVFQQQDTTSSYCGFRVYTSGSVIRFQSHHTDGTSQTISTFTLPIQNVPLYYGVTADDTFFRIFINGVQYSATVRSTAEYVSGSDIYIGRAEGAYRYWDGKISHLFMVDRAMSASEHDTVWRKGQMNIERPTGDHFKDAPVIVADAGPVSSTSVGASSDPVNDPMWNYDNSLSIARNVWFKFIPPTDEPYKITFDSSFGAVSTLYAYIGPDDLEVPIWTDFDSKMSFLSESGTPGVKALNHGNSHAEAGQAIYLSAGAARNVILTPGAFTIEIESFPAPPANDDFADATTIDVSTSGTIAGSTLNSSIEDSQEGVATGCPEFSVWYKFVADATGSITFDTCNGTAGEYDYYGVAAWDATADSIVTVADVDWTTPLDADVNSGNANSGCGEITFSVISGNTYYLHVVHTDVLPSADSFVLSWTDIT